MSAVNTYRALFVGHGSPMLALQPEEPAHGFLQQLGRDLPRPRGIVLVSPHWMGRGFAIKSPPRYTTWHDFGGFPPELYQQQYTPAGDPALAHRMLQLMQQSNLPASLSDDTRLDHGGWVPLKLMYPHADVPLVQISGLQGDPKAHYELGQALRPLANEDVLVIGSGSLTHNLRDLRPGSSLPDVWASEFADWMTQNLLAGNESALLDYRRLAPHAMHAHPSEEHLMPLYVALGMGGNPTVLHDSFALGNLSMATFGFA